MMITGLADGLLAHSSNGQIYTEINFLTDEHREDSGMARGEKPWPLFYAAYRMTGNNKYLEPLPKINQTARVFDKEMIAQRYRDEIINLGIREYINTEGSIWIDRISPFNPVIQQDRLGGVALTRTNELYPKHFVSWRFKPPSNFDDLAIFIQDPSETGLKIIAYNLDEKMVNTSMTTWDLKPGKWRIRQGIDTDDDQLINSGEKTSIVDLERGNDISLAFEPRKNTIIILELITPSGKDYSKLPDLAIGPEDIKITGGEVRVRVHNIGAVESAVTTLAIKDSAGRIIASAKIDPIEAPVDLLPRWKSIVIPTGPGIDLTGGIIILDPEEKISEITRLNNKLKLWDKYKM
jgi:hypothetical protein